MSTRSGKRGKKRNRNASRELSASAVSYSGPIRTISEKSQTDCHTQVVTYTSTIDSSAGGVISTFFVNSISSGVDWTNLIAIYDEYRILGVELEFMPSNRYSKTTTVVNPAVLAEDRKDFTTLPASYNDIVGKGSFEKVSLEDPWKKSMRMSGVEDAGWGPVGTTNPPYGWKMYASGLSASTTYGRYFFYWRVQFRGRS